MRFPLFMARRYLFSKKKVGAINIISGISVAGVAFCTAALLVTLSVFNGFHDLIGQLYTQFDPPLKVIPAEGKSVDSTDSALQSIARLNGVEAASFCYEDNALILFRGHPTVINLKGVDTAYEHVTGIRSILYGNGSYQLQRGPVSYGIPGIGLASQMGGVDYGTLEICAPRRGERINMANPAESFNAADLTSARVCFSVSQRKYDESYMICPLEFAQKLFEQPGRVTSLELKLKPDADVADVQKEARELAAGRFKVLTQMEQQEDVFNIMNIEKTMAYLFLTFILLIACFNIVGSVSMLIIDKQKDVTTLRHLGATPKLTFRIFLYEGHFIALLGAVIGTVVGLILCWAQQAFGLVSMGSSQSNFIISAYPVSVHLGDVVLVLVTVTLVGFLAVWYPVKSLSRKFL